MKGGEVGVDLSYGRGTLAEGFAFLELEPEGARGNPTQDLALLQKR